MVILQKNVIDMFRNNPESLCKWMHNLNEMREVLISIFILHNIHGWQGLKSALSKFDFEFETRDLIVFYSRYELDAALVDTLLKLVLKLSNK
jgi:hypothetical protein